MVVLWRVRKETDHLDTLIAVRWWSERWAGEVEENAGILSYLAGKIEWALQLIGQGEQVRQLGKGVTLDCNMGS